MSWHYEGGGLQLLNKFYQSVLKTNIVGFPTFPTTPRIILGSIHIESVTCEHDVVIDRGEVSKRKKKPSKKFRDTFGHTPLSLEEHIPWRCRRLVVGTRAYGRLPVMNGVRLEAGHRDVELLILPTAQAIEVLQQDPDETNAILHVTC